MWRVRVDRFSSWGFRGRLLTQGEHLVEDEELARAAAASGLEVEEVPTEEPTQEERFVCQECGAEFSSERGLQAHRRRHGV